MKLSNPKIFNRFILIVWGMLWVNFFTQYVFNIDLLEAFLAPTLYMLVVYPPVTYLSTKLLRKAIATRKWKRFAGQFVLASVICGTLIFMLLLLFMHLESRNVFNESDFFTSIGSLAHELVNVSLAAALINFGFCGLRFLEATLSLQGELHEYQLKTLNGQINPHSMFNILNHIHILLQRDPEEADKLLLQYADILRYQLYKANSDKVSLWQDTDHLKEYIEVEKIRWRDKVVVNESWEIEEPEMQIPPLLFIPFMENAFKHMARSDSEKGIINISFSQVGGDIHFKVDNSKSLIGKREKSEKGIGLPNIMKRLEILYPGRHELQINESDTHYYVSLKLAV